YTKNEERRALATPYWGPGTPPARRTTSRRSSMAHWTPRSHKRRAGGRSGRGGRRGQMLANPPGAEGAKPAGRGSCRGSATKAYGSKAGPAAAVRARVTGPEPSRNREAARGVPGRERTGAADAGAGTPPGKRPKPSANPAGGGRPAAASCARRSSS